MPFAAEFACRGAVVQGDGCFVAGTTGYACAAMSMPAATMIVAVSPSRSLRCAHGGHGIARVSRRNLRARTVTETMLAIRMPA